MRIRGYDEETEELSDDLVNISGTIADLTKTASDSTGVSLFEAGDPDTYRSTYDILADIADIWDEITDKNQAELLEALFGKRQAQIGAAILSNFDSAAESIEKMANATGSADAEMEKIYNSLDYKLNALSETWTGVAQNLFQTDDLKLVVDGLTALSSVVDSATEHLGLFGSIGVVAFGVGVAKVISNAKQITSAITPIITSLQGVSTEFTTNQAAALKYATSLSGLSAAEQQIVMNAMGLNASQKQLLASTIAGTTAIQGMTIAGLENALGVEAGTVSNKLNAQSHDVVTSAIIEQVFADETLRAKLMQLIASTEAQTVANEGAAASYNLMGKSAKAASLAMLSSPLFWVTTALTVLPMVVSLIKDVYESINQASEIALEAAEDLHTEYNDLISEGEDLNSELETTNERIAELQKLSDEGTITLVEADELENLKETNRQLEQEIKNKKALADDKAKEADEKYKEAFEKASFVTDDLSNDWAELAGLDQHATQEELIYLQKIQSAKSAEDSINSLIDAYQYYLGLQENGNGLTDEQAERFGHVETALREAYDTIATTYRDPSVGEEYTEYYQSYLDSIYKIIDATEYWLAELDDIPTECTDKLNELGEAGELTADDIRALAQQFPDFKQWIFDSGFTVSELVSHFNALSVAEEEAAETTEETVATYAELIEMLDSASDSISSLNDAYEDFTSDGAVSYSTISDISDKFSELNINVDDYIAVLLDATSSQEDINQALSDLTYQALEASVGVDTLASSDTALIAKMLEEQGVANSVAVAEYAVMQARVKAGVQAASASGDVITLVRSLTSEAEEAGISRDALISLAAQMIATNNTTMTFDEQISALTKLAATAGVASSLIASIGGTYSDYLSGLTTRQKHSGNYLSEAEWQAQTVSDYAQSLIDSLGETATVPAYGGGTSSSSSGSSSSSTSEIEEYIAEIEDYRKALEKLNRTELSIDSLETKIEYTDDYNEKIDLTYDLIQAYEDEQTALHELNDERDATISAGVKSLQALGFEVEYNANTNELWIENLEHLNELTADSAGEYDTLQEATNALREETEDLVNTITELNEDNQDASDTWWELRQNIKDAKDEIVDYLNEIVEAANDVVDGFQDVYATLTDAASEYAQNGYLSVDSLQSILDLGPQYLQYLVDENGQLVINEESLQAVIAAKTEEMAAETALAYAKQVLQAVMDNDIESLKALTDAEYSSSDASWSAAYGTLALAKAIATASGIESSYVDEAIADVKKMQTLTETAVNSISEYYKTLDANYVSQADALETILSIVEEIVKQESEDQIEAIENQISAYQDLIDAKKEALEASKDESDYEDEIADKIEEIAKLQSQINTLSLDDSRDAQAQKAELETQLAELQEELADAQADHALEVTEDALDDMAEAYEDEKNAEIAELEDALSSTEKLYQASIAYIQDNWEDLYDIIIDYNYEYGSSVESDVVAAWEAVYDVLEQCNGEYEKALQYVEDYTTLTGKSSSSSSSSSSSATASADSTASSALSTINSIIKQMITNSNNWFSASSSEQTALSEANVSLAKTLASYLGVSYGSSSGIYRDGDGTWYYKGKALYSQYPLTTYHEGGVVGSGDLDANEKIAKLKDNEWVLSEEMVSNLAAQMDIIDRLTSYFNQSDLVSNMQSLAPVVNYDGLTPSNNTTITIGNTTISGADDKTVKQHAEITRKFTNQILAALDLKK